MEFRHVESSVVDSEALHLNHYQLQSRNWFAETKNKRGNANVKADELIKYTMEYFHKLDINISNKN